MIFEVQQGSFGYKGRAPLLNGVSFSVRDGEVLSVLGPNGVGKTTLMRCMIGLLKWSSGGSYIDGVNIKEIPSKKLWQRIAYVPQAKGFAFSYTLEEMVLLGRSSHIGITAQPGAEDLRICREVMESVGIINLKDKYCNQVSGGELQMALIARALCSRPSMLILDEPESNLDFRNQLIILETIQELAAGQNISCILNTHYPVHALKVSTHSLILSRDGMCVHGESGKIINSETMKRVFQVQVHINHVHENGFDYDTVTAVSIV